MRDVVVDCFQEIDSRLCASHLTPPEKHSLPIRFSHIGLNGAGKGNAPVSYNVSRH
jgi:hypothetical protein